MAHTKAMGIGAMLVLLVVSVVLLPMIVRFVGRNEPHFVVSGFQDLAQSDASASGSSSGPVHVPAHAAGSMAKMYHPDPNTNFMCGSPNGSGQSCPEGTFCDGLTQSCVPTFVGGAVPDTGYYS